MRPFTAEDLLDVRDVARGEDTTGRALAVLARAFPDDTADGLRRLPLGQRNARLLAVRKEIFGSAIEAYAECPHCGEELELPLDADAFGSPPAPPAELRLDHGDYAIRFRLLDSSDLQAASRCRDVSAARVVLLERCVVEARHGDRAVTAAALPPEVVEQLAARLEACDPLAETLLDLRCPACEGEWQMAFDVASFLHHELDLEARRLLGEIHALARGYGWREADILAMPARRRRDYLELLLR